MKRLPIAVLAMTVALQAFCALPTLIVVVNETEFVTREAKENFETLVKMFSNVEKAPEAKGQPTRQKFYREFIENMKSDVTLFRRTLATERQKLLVLCRTGKLRIILHTNANLRARKYETCDSRNGFRGFVKRPLKWTDFEKVEHWDFIIENQPLLSQEIFFNIVNEGRTEEGLDYIAIKSHGAVSSKYDRGKQYLVGPLMIDVRKLEPRYVRERIAEELVENKLGTGLAAIVLSRRPEFRGINVRTAKKEDVAELFWRLKDFDVRKFFVKIDILKKGFLSNENTPFIADHLYGTDPYAYEFKFIHGRGGGRTKQFRMSLVSSCWSQTHATRASFHHGRAVGVTGMAKHEGLTGRLDKVVKAVNRGVSFGSAFRRAATEN